LSSLLEYEMRCPEFGDKFLPLYYHSSERCADKMVLAREFLSDHTANKRLRSCAAGINRP
jgi:hypothetical protein